MTLPGKLTIGFLQEDNPQKFYFRVRPLLIQDEGGYHPMENAKDKYLEDGFIRIVPDKNELSNFKTRMRTLGRYCAIDLRKHPGENDKIRPNKNHNGENGDRNAYIVYSDVITAVDPLRMAEVVEVDEDGMFNTPGTKLIALRQEDTIQGVYQWDERGEQGAFIVGDNLSASVLSDEDVIHLVLPDGEEVDLLMDMARFGVSIGEKSAERVAERNAEKTAERVNERVSDKNTVEKNTAEKSISEKSMPEKNTEKTAETAPKAETPVKDEICPKAENAAMPELVQEVPVKVEREVVREVIREVSNRETAREAAREAAREVIREENKEKPWMHRTTFLVPRVVSSKPPMNLEQSLSLQSGFNPRRSMSIKEIMDEKWRESRLDTLGHPVVSDATSMPAVNPVEQAMTAVKQAWELPEARTALVNALLKLEKMDEALGANGAPDAAQVRVTNAAEEQMVRLEADRLKLLGDIDELRRLRQEKRTELVNDLRHTHSAEFDRSEARNKQLLELQQQYILQTEQARKASEQAQQEFAQQFAAEIDQKLTEQLISGRAMDMMAALSRKQCAPARRLETEEMTAGALISTVRVRFEEAGITLTHDEAVNVLACLALGRIVAVSGESGSGKSKFVRTLAAALGIAGENSDSFAEVQAQADWRSIGREIEGVSPNGVAVVKMPAVKRVLENDDQMTVTMLMVDGANRGKMDDYMGELLTLGEQGAPNVLSTAAGTVHLSDSLRVMLTVQDGGSAMSGELLERAWLMRLNGEDDDGCWPPKAGEMPKPEKAISLENIKKVFAVGADVGSEVGERVRMLREKLASHGMKLSRRTLTDLYNYCSAATQYMRCTPLEVLDWAFSQRAMPKLLATANLDSLQALPKILPDMPRSLKLIHTTLPLPTL